MTEDQMKALVHRYEGEYVAPQHFEHRVDEKSELQMYSLIRNYKPVSCLEIGSWNGGSSCAISAALLRNNKPFKYVISELLEDRQRNTLENVKETTKYEPLVVGDITKNLKKIPEELDFLFVDTDHDLETTKWILENIFPRVSKDSPIVFHDWAVKGETEWKAKDSAWPETIYMVDLHNAGKLPLVKIYFNYEEGDSREMGFFLKE